MSSDSSLTMMRLLSGYWISQTLYVLAELGIADELALGPASAATLAQRRGAHEPSLGRLLRALASVGILAEARDGTFAQTELSATLRTDAPGSLREVARLGGHPLHWAAWGKLLHSVRTGETAFDAAHGRAFFEALALDPELTSTFGGALGSLVTLDVALASCLPLSAGQSVLDLGGGTGQLARALKALVPDARVGVLERAGVAEPDPAIELRVGDFLVGVPEGFDLYVLKFVVQDFDDARALALFRNVAAAMDKEARLFVAEAMVPEDGTASSAQVHDVNMMVLTGGKQRTLAEHHALLEAAGLRPLGGARALGELCVLVAVRAT